MEKCPGKVLPTLQRVPPIQLDFRCQLLSVREVSSDGAEVRLKSTCRGAFSSLAPPVQPVPGVVDVAGLQIVRRFASPWSVLLVRVSSPGSPSSLTPKSLGDWAALFVQPWQRLGSLVRAIRRMPILSLGQLRG
mmetsp:Transcript_1844/g.4072  ORF Transcript_1844/g.4072 Transcript_1844/m.4072 type:complete len:134 (+) Transcript_1844:669-1070(+)